MKVLIVGSGTMGSGIAQVIALSKMDVIINDLSQELLDRAYQRISKTLDKLVRKEKITVELKEEVLSHISTSVDIKTCRDVDLVIEAASENMEIKKKIFKTLDENISKKAILATNTSSLSITEIASSTNRKEKVIGIHFFNPAPVMKLVEVVKTFGTSKETLDKTLDFVKQISKEAVIVEEAPGFVVNRILIPLINEAVAIYSENIASVEDIDKAMK